MKTPIIDKRLKDSSTLGLGENRERRKKEEAIPRVV
jgi:hypothetical protein